MCVLLPFASAHRTSRNDAHLFTSNREHHREFPRGVRAPEREVAGLQLAQLRRGCEYERQVGEDLLALGLCDLMSLPILVGVPRVPLEAFDGLVQTSQPI